MSAPIYAASEFGASRETDADSRIMKLKDGSTHLAQCFVLKHKAENAVDLDKGVILAAKITPGPHRLCPFNEFAALRDRFVMGLVCESPRDNRREQNSDEQEPEERISQVVHHWSFSEQLELD